MFDRSAVTLKYFFLELVVLVSFVRRSLQKAKEH